MAVLGMSFMTPEPDTPPTSSPDSYPMSDLFHAALQSKEYLGRASAGAQPLTALLIQLNYKGVIAFWKMSKFKCEPLDPSGTTTNPTQAVPGIKQSESTATAISPGLLTTTSSSADRQTGLRSTMSSLPVEEETTTTLITTTTITTMHVPGTAHPVFTILLKHAISTVVAKYCTIK